MGAMALQALLVFIADRATCGDLSDRNTERCCIAPARRPRSVKTLEPAGAAAVILETDGSFGAIKSGAGLPANFGAL